MALKKRGFLVHQKVSPSADNRGWGGYGGGGGGGVGEGGSKVLSTYP